MPREYKLYIEDTIESIKKIEDYTKNITHDKFVKNNLIIDGVVRNLEIIGEAVKEIPTGTRERYNSINWKKITGLRDMISHRYFGIDVEIIWDIVKNKIPELKSCITEISNTLNAKK